MLQSDNEESTDEEELLSFENLEKSQFTSDMVQKMFDFETDEESQ